MNHAFLFLLTLVQGFSVFAQPGGVGGLQTEHLVNPIGVMAVDPADTTQHIRMFISVRRHSLDEYIRSGTGPEKYLFFSDLKRHPNTGEEEEEKRALSGGFVVAEIASHAARFEESADPDYDDGLGGAGRGRLLQNRQLFKSILII